MNCNNKSYEKRSQTKSQDLALPNSAQHHWKKKKWFDASKALESCDELHVVQLHPEQFEAFFNPTPQPGQSHPSLILLIILSSGSDVGILASRETSNIGRIITEQKNKLEKSCMIELHTSNSTISDKILWWHEGPPLWTSELDCQKHILCSQLHWKLPRTLL